MGKIKQYNLKNKLNMEKQNNKANQKKKNFTVVKRKGKRNYLILKGDTKVIALFVLKNWEKKSLMTIKKITQ